MTTERNANIITVFNIYSTLGKIIHDYLSYHYINISNGNWMTTNPSTHYHNCKYCLHPQLMVLVHILYIKHCSSILTILITRFNYVSWISVALMGQYLARTGHQVHWYLDNKCKPSLCSMWPTIICGNLNPKAKPSRDSQMFMISFTIPFKWALKLVTSIKHVFMKSYTKSPAIIRTVALKG